MAEPPTTAEASAELLAAALDHARRGWRVFPLRPGDKRPAMRDWETRATTDPDRITRAWTAGAFNIGIATGPSGLVVLDLDQPKPGTVPPPAWRQPGIRDGGDVLAALAEANDQPLPVETYTVRTGSGGMHLYFAAPADAALRNTAGRLGWLIDTRAAGGYVVAAGSMVAGRTLHVARRPRRRPSCPGGSPHRLDRHRPAPADDDRRSRSGTRPPTRPPRCAANSTGCSPRNRGQPQPRPQHRRVRARPARRRRTAPRQLVEDALALAGQAIGLPAGECAKTIRSGLDSGARTPRTAA